MCVSLILGINFWIGILTSFIGSFILIMGLFVFVKPHFKISKEICHLTTDEYGEGLKGSFLIKVANKSFFNAYDLRANLEILEIYHIDGGANNRAFELNLVDKTSKFLGGRHYYKNTGRSCFLFRTEEPLKEKLSKSNNKVRFTLIAKNGFSGLTKIFVQEYNVSSKIKDGHFCFGKNFDIK